MVFTTIRSNMDERKYKKALKIAATAVSVTYGLKDDDHLPEVIESRENVRNMYSFITSILPGLNDNQYAAQQIEIKYLHEYVRMKYGKPEQSD